MATQELTARDPSDILQEKDYDAIENAVMETARGRWFLAEYARRHRAADTDMLLNAITRLEKSLSERTVLSTAALEEMDAAIESNTGTGTGTDGEDDLVMEKVLLDVAELSAAIQLTRQEIEELGAKQSQDGGFEQASSELDAIVTHTETATGEILNAAEAMQEETWALREAGADPEVCDKIDNYAIEIYMACSFQDITGQRIAKVVSLMSFVESHVQKMMDIWHAGEAVANEAKKRKSEMNGDDTSNGNVAGAIETDDDLLNGPALDGHGLGQDNIDDILNGDMDIEFDAIEPETDTAEPDVFAAEASDIEEVEVDADSGVFTIDDASEDVEIIDIAANAEAFEGQDAFESIEETLKHAQ
ncbi:MAG: hypothetical protein COA52_05245 [Hyphomicrobiales bacterium]|nr:MAG: hypothetical protein COA52_05245 [Hyphomicrobiales bacterium]